MGKKVLVVDDAQNTRSILRFMLESRGYELSEAADGVEALRKARSAPPPDLILLDAMMPRKSGFEVCRELKDDPGLRAIPVILLTAVAPTAAEESGADRFFAKPFKVNELLETIEGFLGAKVTK